MLQVLIPNRHYSNYLQEIKSEIDKMSKHYNSAKLRQYYYDNHYEGSIHLK